MEYDFYIQEVDKNGEPNGVTKNLEKDFDGLRYKSAEGIEDIGEAKNIYIEKYADSDKLRSYVPTEIVNEATTVTLELYFFGDSRQKTFDEFNEFIRKGYHKYWDTARKKEFVFFVKDDIKPTEDKYKDGLPYMEVHYKLRNINGKTKKNQDL